MSRARKHDIDLFFQFCLDEGGFDSLAAAAAGIPVDASTLNRANARRIRSLPSMARWASIFSIPRSKLGEWIANNIDALVTDTELIELVS